MDPDARKPCRLRGWTFVVGTHGADHCYSGRGPSGIHRLPDASTRKRRRNPPSDSILGRSFASFSSTRVLLLQQDRRTVRGIRGVRGSGRSASIRSRESSRARAALHLKCGCCNFAKAARRHRAGRVKLATFTQKAFTSLSSNATNRQPLGIARRLKNRC